MKRTIAVLLSMTMVLALAGCSKEEETTKKKKSKKTTKTEDTEDPDDTDPSESTDETDPTDDTDPTDTSETADSSTSGTTSSGDPYNMDLPKLTHDLQFLTFKNDPVKHNYGELASNDEIYQAMYSLDVYSVEDAGYTALNDYLDQVNSGYESRLAGLYENSLDTLSEHVADADPDAYWGETLYTYSLYRIYRTDSKVCSFYTADYASSSDTEDSSIVYHNLDSKTAEVLTFDDIVFDRSAFAEVLSEYILPSDPDDYSERIEERNSTLTALIEMVKNGSDISFLMTQNTIILFLEGPSAGEVMTYSFSIPVLHLGGCVDLSYFTSTAEYYCLTADDNDEIYWDFDEDGSLDIVTVTELLDGYDFDLEISYNGNISPMGASNSDIDYAYGISWVCMVHTDSGYYLYVELMVEDPVNRTLIYHLNNGAFEYVNYTSEIAAIPYDPANMRILACSELVGTGSYSVECTLIGSNGVPQPTSSFYAKSAVVATVKDMTLGIFDNNGNPTGDSITLPAGTVVQFTGIDTEKKLAYFRTLNKDESENREFQMIIYEKDYGGYDIYFDGESAYDLFVGEHYYD
ncbi:MAG: hypothetical protein J5750_02275 [Clostridiales bacterium]|nr:hypothetical protein [Clostridiales bacterium]